MSQMKAKYSGKCRSCGDRFGAGADIVYTRSAPKGQKTVHASCAGVSSNFYADSASAARGTFYASNGRCEDAPCCGCCGTWGA